MFNERIVFLDLETTGGNATYDRIIEIGLIEVDRGRFVDEWSTLVNPGRHIPAGIQALTGITDDMVAVAPSFENVSAALAKRLDGKVLVAHNARFDYGFLKNEFLRAGLRYFAQVLCTVKLSRRLNPQHRRHNLDALIIRHALFCIDRHRALGDARVLWELAQIWQRELTTETLVNICAELLRRPTVPAGLSADIFDRLPEAPGVYIFYGADELVLYVGKSLNIRSRVMNHFAGDSRGGRDARIAAEIKRIDWIEAAGELGADMKEAQLVRELAPVYNRQRRPAELCAWHWRPDKPETPPELVAAGELYSARFTDLYGLFRSRIRAIEALRELAASYSLCHTLLGLEEQQHSGACSARELKRCHGACIGIESPIRHAMRLAQAFAGLRMRPWPYAGRIGLRERHAASERSELHILDRWCYLGSVKSEADLYEITEAAGAPAFDLDTYKILTRFLRAPPSSCDIVLLPTVSAHNSA